MYLKHYYFTTFINKNKIQKKYIANRHTNVLQLYISIIVILESLDSD